MQDLGRMIALMLVGGLAIGFGVGTAFGPVVREDVIAADDAIRSRSLHVLAGGGAALILYCVLGQLAALNLPTIDPAGAAATAIALSSFVVSFLVPILGYVVATRAWQVDRRAAA